MTVEYDCLIPLCLNPRAFNTCHRPYFQAFRRSRLFSFLFHSLLISSPSPFSSLSSLSWPCRSSSSWKLHQEGQTRDILPEIRAGYASWLLEIAFGISFPPLAHTSLHPDYANYFNRSRPQTARQGFISSQLLLGILDECLWPSLC